MKGFLLIDKPKGITSFDLVRDVRRLMGERKIGHAGTLDKLASGLMILALGEGTKLLEYLIGLDKEYEVRARFGAMSETYDGEGPIVETEGFDAKSNEGILKLIEKTVKESFLGEIEQLPPRYSALKLAGKRASDRVRDGEVVEMKARGVEIYVFEVKDFNWPEVRFRIKCGSGTYVRSLVNDLGEKLGFGAYVTDLRRTKVGGLKIEDAVELSKIVEQRLVSLEEFVRFDVAEKWKIFELNDEEFEGLKDGKTFKSNKVEREVLGMAFYKEKLIGVLQVDETGEGVKFSKLIF